MAGSKRSGPSGAGDKDRNGACNCFGTDEKVAGIRGGKLETGCTGPVEGARAGNSEIIRLPLPANIDGNAATAEALKAERLKDPTIDSVVTFGAAVTGSVAPPAGPTWCRRS